MALTNPVVLVLVLIATNLGVLGVSLPTSTRSLSGCGYTFTTGRENLYAGIDQQEVGFVDWTFSDAGVTVKYTITSECDPGTAHVELTESVLSRPTPGRFDCNIQGSGPSVTLICGNEYLADLSCCSTKYLYTHLELTCGDELETAYAGEERCSGRSWCNYVKIDPPCDGCACNEKCLAKQTCPDGCNGEDLFCPADLAASCTKKETCPDGCNGADLFCPADLATSCTKKVQCEGACNADKFACSLDECPLCCPKCFEAKEVDGVQTCVPAATDDCDPCEGGGSQLCEDLGNLPNSFKCCPPTSTCKTTILGTRLGVEQGAREVSFVCSSKCGGCDDKTNDGSSAGCALFSPIVLGPDGDPDTDDILNVCNGSEGLVLDNCPPEGCGV